MDLLLLLIGIVCLLRNRYSSVIAIIVILASSYLQLNVDPKYHNFLFVHNVTDTGLFLYILFFFKIAMRYGVTTRHPLVRYIHLFFAFLIINGIYDIYCGTSIGDVIRYCRHWSFLTIVYIVPYIKREWTLGSLKIIYYVTAACCLLLLFQRFTGITIVEIRSIGLERGVKPPSFSIWCAAMCLINVWRYGGLKRVIHLLIFLSPILLNMKMTYAISIISIYVVYFIVSSHWSLARKVFASIGLIVSIVIFFSFATSFQERFLSMIKETDNIGQEEVTGNFSYRILHATERYDYIMREPETAIRGLGYVSETNFKNGVFNIGLRDEDTNDIVQLNTGDIAWSLFFVRFGLLGLAVYLLMYFRIVVQYGKHMRDNRFNGFFFSMLLVFLFFSSLGNTIIAYSDFFIYPLLFINRDLLLIKECE